jgi:hypothetical protein
VRTRSAATRTAMSWRIRGLCWRSSAPCSSCGCAPRSGAGR